MTVKTVPHYTTTPNTTWTSSHKAHNTPVNYPRWIWKHIQGSFMVTSSIQYSQRRRVDTRFYRKCMIESYLNVFNLVFSKKVRVHKRLLEVCDWNISEFVWRNQLEVAAHQVPRWLHFWSSIQLGPAVEWLIALTVSSRIEADRFGRSELKGDIQLCFNTT